METFENEVNEINGAKLQTLYNPSDFDKTIINNNEQEIYGETIVENTTEKTEIICLACNKHFTIQNSLKRHKERSPVCLQWLTIKENETINLYKEEVNIIDLIEQIKIQATVGKGNSNQCKYCNKKFSNIGNFHKHYKTSISCNLMAINSFITNVKSFPSS
jgi:uncharacterized CHY-type Zn-finger protein